MGGHVRRGRARHRAVPDGTSFRSVSRFAKFANVPELLRMFHVPADVKTAEDLKLPTPAIAGGKPETVVVPSSPELSALVRALGARAEAVRSRAVRPEEDNMLKISSDGRAAALDLRLRGLDRPVGATKLDVVADRVADIWAAHRADTFLDVGGEPHPRPGALQLVFCDLGTPSAEHWNVYDELRAQLVARGLPRHAVRFIHEATTDQAKADLFAGCRSGAVSCSSAPPRRWALAPMSKPGPSCCTISTAHGGPPTWPSVTAVSCARATRTERSRSCATSQKAASTPTPGRPSNEKPASSASSCAAGSTYARSPTSAIPPCPMRK